MCKNSGKPSNIAQKLKVGPNGIGVLDNIQVQQLSMYRIFQLTLGGCVLHAKQHFREHTEQETCMVCHTLVPKRFIRKHEKKCTTKFIGLGKRKGHN